MTRLLDAVGLVLATLVAGCVVLVMWLTVAPHAAECGTWSQQAAGVEWVCQDGVG